VEYNSVLSTLAEAENIGRFGRYRYVGKTQISADISARPIYRSISSQKVLLFTFFLIDILLKLQQQMLTCFCTFN